MLGEESIVRQRIMLQAHVNGVQQVDPVAGLESDLGSNDLAVGQKTPCVERTSIHQGQEFRSRGKD